MTTIQHAGFIVTDAENNVVYGASATVDAAWDEVKRDVLAKNPVLDYYGNPVPEDEVFEKHYRVHSASKGLLDMLSAYGGNIPWRTVDGIACTDAEADAT